MTDINIPGGQAMAPPQKKLPSDLTSYDLFKAIAVIFMVIDHLGMYFFPEELLFRSLGRLGVPVWFFLVGYSKGRDIPFKLLGGACLLLAFDIVMGRAIFPLNTLFTIILIRMSIDYVMRYAMSSEFRLWCASAIMVALIPYTYVVVEYGSVALIAAVYGYLVRHKNLSGDDALVFRYMIFSFLIFVGLQQIAFLFPAWQFYMVLLGTFVFYLYLLYFKPVSFSKLTHVSPKPLTWALQVMGRRTLEIYVIHLAVFKVIYFYTLDSTPQFFDVSLFLW